MRWYDKAVLGLVLYSVLMLFLEMSLGGKDSLHSPAFFLWSERVVALALTLEFLYRCYDHATPHDGGDRDYFRSPEMVFDLIAVAPFWIGFLVPEEYLEAVRSMRILRLLKFYQISPVAHLVVENLIAQYKKLRLIGSFTIIMVLFSSFTIHHLESAGQPESFGRLWSCAWWSVVTMTTVGYGDMFPKTVPGQVVGMFLMLVAISVVGALISVVSSAFTHSNIDEAFKDGSGGWSMTKSKFRQYEEGKSN